MSVPQEPASASTNCSPRPPLPAITGRWFVIFGMVPPAPLRFVTSKCRLSSSITNLRFCGGLPCYIALVHNSEAIETASAPSPQVARLDATHPRAAAAAVVSAGSVQLCVTVMAYPISPRTKPRRQVFRRGCAAAGALAYLSLAYRFGAYRFGAYRFGAYRFGAYPHVCP